MPIDALVVVLLGCFVGVGGVAIVVAQVRQLLRMGRPLARRRLIWKTRASVTFEKSLLPNQFYSQLVSSIGFTEHECVLSVFGVRRALDIHSITRRTGSFKARSLRIVTQHGVVLVYPNDLDGTLYVLRQMGFAM